MIEKASYMTGKKRERNALALQAVTDVAELVKQTRFYMECLDNSSHGQQPSERMYASAHLCIVLKNRRAKTTRQQE
jgi:hypothetical protein